jgi:MFS family permease
VPHLTKDFYNSTSEVLEFTNTTSEVLDFANSASEVLDFTNTFTLSERSWIASVSLFGQLVSALISGFVSNSIGRKNCLLLFNTPLLAGWLMLIFHQGNFYVCLFGRILQGFGVIPSIGKI